VILLLHTPAPRPTDRRLACPSVDRGRLEDPLKRVLAWSLSPDAPERESLEEKLRGEQDAAAAVQALQDLPYRYERTAAKCRRMLWHLYTSGFASFS